MGMKHFSTSNNTLCWVYITHTTEGSNRLIKYTIDLNARLLQLRDANLIYYRLFNNVADAVAYKLLLEKLSPKSVDSIIRKANPRFQDLKPQLIQTI